MAKNPSYNQTVIQFFGLGRKAGDVGIEHEIEFDGTVPNTAPNGWLCKGDGSLRNGCEFVTRGPVKADKVEAVVASLGRFLEAHEPRLRVQMSYRCSTHLHINVQQLTFQEVLSFVALFVLFEKPLVIRYGGDLRRSNNFCMMLSEAEWLATYLRQTFVHDRMNNLATDNIRYASVNMKAVADYGSVEFRFMRGTIDAAEVNSLASKLVALRDYAKGMSPNEVAEQLSGNGIEDLATRIFGADHGLELNIDDAYDNIRILQPALYAVDWKKAPEVVIEEDAAVEDNGEWEHRVPDRWVPNFNAADRFPPEARPHGTHRWANAPDVRNIHRAAARAAGYASIFWYSEGAGAYHANGNRNYMIEYL